MAPEMARLFGKVEASNFLSEKEKKLIYALHDIYYRQLFYDEVCTGEEPFIAFWEHNCQKLIDELVELNKIKNDE